MTEEDQCSLSKYQLALELEQSHWNTLEWKNPDDITRGCSLSSYPPSVATSDGDSPVSIKAPDSDEERLEEEEISDDTAVDNDNVRSILQSADLRILQPPLVNNAYDSEDREEPVSLIFLQRIIWKLCFLGLPKI
jgi:hypothetical protein